jgi:hypothetical protein
VFGGIDPRTTTPEDLQALRGVVARTVSESEAFWTIKVWRALWKNMAAMGCCARDDDPSFVFANSAPLPRQEIWPHHDVLRMVQRAWRERYYGLAAIVAVAWDTMLSPIDRSLNHRGSARERQSWSGVLSRSREDGSGGRRHALALVRSYRRRHEDFIVLGLTVCKNQAFADPNGTAGIWATA